MADRILPTKHLYGINGLVTTAALGTPPQPFRLVFDLVWDTLFVPNASIDQQTWDLHLYYANESTTAAPSDLGRRSVDRDLVDFSGPVVKDTFRISGGEVARQPFVAAERAYSQGVNLWIFYDSVLGLSPRFNHGGGDMPEDRLPSPWSRMVRKGVLDANLFALEVPRVANGDMGNFPAPGPRTKGYISFGAIHPKNRGAQFESLPLVRDDDGLWAVEAQSVRWDNQKSPIDHRFDDDDDDDNKTVTVFTTEPVLAIPDAAFVRQIHRSIPAWAWREEYYDQVLDCAGHDHLPDLVLELGDRENKKTFTVTARQYAFPVHVKGGDEGSCLFSLVSTAWYKGCLGGAAPRGAVVLGTGFLNAYYSVYDVDAMEVRRELPSPLNPHDRYYSFIPFHDSLTIW